MKRTTSITSAAVLLITVALLASTGLAGTIFIPVAGEGPVTTVDPGIEWTDADGITHIRDRIQIGGEVGQDVNGIPISQETVYVADLNIDMVTGNGSYHSKALGNPTSYGDLTGSFHGNMVATITGFVMSGTYIYARGFGDFAGWKHRGTFSSALGSSWVTFEGVFQVPGGGDGNKAAATEAETWSSVKSLFR